MDRSESTAAAPGPGEHALGRGWSRDGAAGGASAGAGADRGASASADPRAGYAADVDDGASDGGGDRHLSGLLREDPGPAGDGNAGAMPPVQDRHGVARLTRLTTALPPGLGPQRRRHREMLVISLFVIALSFALFVRADGRVALRGLGQYPMPETCLSHTLFGIDCPACGLTRSFIELARGDWSASLSYHRLGWMMALAVLLQVPYRGLCLMTSRSLVRPITSTFALALIGALLLNWLIGSVR